MLYNFHRFIRSNAEIVACAVMAPVILVTIWMIIFNITHSRQRHDLLTEITEIQWRSTQLREELVILKGLLTPDGITAKKISPDQLSMRSQFIIANIKGMLAEPFLQTFLNYDEIEVYQNILLYFKSMSTSAKNGEPINYEKTYIDTEEFRKDVNRLNKIAYNVSHIREKLAEEANKSNLLHLCYALLISFIVLVVLWIYFQKRNMAKFDNEVKHFSLLFAHMTVTRIHGLKMWADDVLSENSPCYPRLLGMARDRIQYLSTMTTWLTRIAYPKHSENGNTASTFLEVASELQGRLPEPKPRFSVSPDAARAKLPFGNVQLILDELLSNARDAMSEQEDQRIAIIAKVDRGFLGRKHLRISVVDNGPGMTAEEVSMALTAFSSSKGEVAGHSGLGLFGCKQLIKAMNGKFRIKSVSGQGTFIEFTYPLRSEA